MLSQTNRQTLRSLRNPAFWMINLGATAICVLSGPFGTLDALPTGFLLIYWGLIVMITSVMATWFHMGLDASQQTTTIVLLAVSGVFGLLVAGLVFALSLSLLPPIEAYPGHLALFSYSFPTAAVIFFISAVVSRSLAKRDNAPTAQRPPLLDRLETFPHAQTILSLSAQDHYVEVTTDIGTELCLIRLNDAIAEVAPLAGFQIHRSHWVAKSAVEKLTTKGTVAQVTLKDGRALNISQSRLPDFKAFLKTA